MSKMKHLAHVDAKQSFHEVVIGTVVKYGEQPCEFQVRLPFLKDDENIIEAQQLMLYCGKEYGMLMVPEIEDKVLVYLYGVQVKKAIILGVLPPKDATFLKHMTKENSCKIFQTKEKVEFKIDDVKDKQKLTMGTPKLTLAFNDEQETCTLQDKDKKNAFSIKQKDGIVHIQAEKELQLECGKSKCSLKKDGSILIEGESVSLKASNIVLDAKQKLTLTAQEIKQDAKVKMECNSKTTLKINSNGILEVQGKLVKIG